MLKNRYFISYFSTTLIYMAMAGLFFYLQQQTRILTEKSEDKGIQLLLSDFVPEVLPFEETPVVKKIEEIVEPEEKVKVEDKNLFKPVIEKPKKKAKKTVKKKNPTKKVSSASSSKTQANLEKVNRFYKKIRVKINENKSYPKLAKRRRMQGSVKVIFTVLRSGKVSNIRINGPKVFHNSARNAVQNAFPIVVKNISVSLPATIDITLHYQIR